MPRILAVEDDLSIIESIKKAFTLESSFQPVFVSDPNQALAAAIAHKPHLILLDIKMPGGDGRQILRTLKDHMVTREIPVIFLTGMSSEGDRAVGLNLGADDYVVKPFGAIELIARIKAVLRRTLKTSTSQETIRSKALTLDLTNRVAMVRGKRCRLQPKEFELLSVLISHAGKTLNRQFLIESMASHEADISSRSLDTHIKNLRKKLGPLGRQIETFPKLGYAWTETP